MLKNINQKYNRLLSGVLMIILLPVTGLAKVYNWSTQEPEIVISSADQLTSVSFNNSSLVGSSSLNQVDLEVNASQFQLLGPVQYFSTSVASTTDFTLTGYLNNEKASSDFVATFIYKIKSSDNWQVLPIIETANNLIKSKVSGSSEFFYAVANLLPQHLTGKKINYFDLSIDNKRSFEVNLSALNHKTVINNHVQLSHVYQIDFLDDNFTTAILKLPLTKLANYRSNLYYLSANEKNWRVLKSGVDQKNQFIKAQVPAKNFQLVLVADKNIQSGTATWYKYKNCNCAASRDWPKNTRLKVTNIEFGSKYYGRSVVVRVNDYGPEIQTGHIIDLDSQAFRKISPKSSGIAPVLIQKVE